MRLDGAATDKVNGVGRCRDDPETRRAALVCGGIDG